MSTQSTPQMALSPAGEARSIQQARLLRSLHTKNAIASSILWFITMLVAATFVAIIISLIWTGFPALTSLSFYGTGAQGIAPELFNTFYILILT